jgi:hypothetical protein
VTAAVSRALAAAANESSGAEPEISSASSMGRTLADAANDKAPGPGRRRIVALAALAAVFVAVAGIASLLAVGARHGHSTGGTSAAGAPASSGPVQPGAAAGAPQLGEQSDPAALAATLRRLLGEASSGSAGSAEAAAPSAPTASCGAAAAASAGLPADARPLLTAGLQWRGQPAEATVFDRPAGSGGRIAVVTSIAGCTVLAHAPV